MAAPNLIQRSEPAMNVIEMLRVSSDRQDVERQEYDVNENRVQHSLNVLRTIRIKISGTLVMTHDEVRAMIESLRDPGVHGVSVSAIDRIFRPKDFNLEILQFLFQNKKAIISSKEGIVEPWTPRGWAVCMGAAQAAGTYLLDLKRNTGGGRRKTQAKERMCQTTPPYGMIYVSKYERDADGRCQYLKEDERPVLYAKGAAPIEGLTKKGVVQMIFAWRVEQKLRVGQIQMKLNRAGLLTDGKKNQYEPGPYGREAVRRLLLNRKYMGEHIEGGVTMACPQYVSPETYEAAQAIFKGEKERSSGRPTVKHLLCGWTRCGKCGKPCQVGTNGKGYAYYLCSNVNRRIYERRCMAKRVRVEKLEAVVWREIWKLLTAPELLIENARAYYDSLPTKKTTAKLEKELSTILARMERTKRMVRSGAEDEETGTKLILEDKQAAAAIEAELRAAGSVLQLPAEHVVRAGCELIASGPEPETFAERRPVLEALVDLKLVYDDAGTVEITGKVPVPDGKASGRGSRNCKGGVTAPCTSTLYIPFILNRRVA